MEDEMFDQNPSEENTDQENTEETVDTAAELEKLKAENKKLSEIIKRRKEQKAQEPSPLPTQAPEAASDVNERLSSVEKELLKQAFAKKHDIPESAMNSVLALTGGKFDDDALENEDIKAVISRHKSKNRVANNTPSAAGAVFKKHGKTWSEMEEADKKANFAEYVKTARDRGKAKR